MSNGDGVTEVLAKFLQCALFTVLKVRGLYPEGSFQRRQVFGHLCWWSTCKEVDDYVSCLCDSLRPAIFRNRLRRVLIPIFEGSRLRERYVIEFPADPQLLTGNSEAEIYHAFGLALTKLEMSPVALWPACAGGVPAAMAAAAQPQPPVWSVQVETRAPSVEEAPREEALGPRWGNAGSTSGAACAAPPGTVVRPLKSIVGGGGSGVHAPPVVLNIYVEDASRGIRSN